ncbi:diacylglycerol/lipid kinase family protein [Nakamurella leprariae]|uniref:Diacylglycerol kinase family lipid kinase n=1 Tax=Nakamurella leprariae TaxID=2803911 RepID=A0A939BZX9_9ACTN|nr:diacylglycerol kinase family protein [Nakamurella leprariae]MBM9468191.1 diacylglycerol kinase family lipid kinase [Nakamurella leprariae]
MRALLIVNPAATATTASRRDLLTHALAGELSLRVAHTRARGHAADLAAAAADAGTDLIVVHAGDGTVNEVVNGMLARGVDAPRPQLAIVPGGSTNVFARAIGVDPDPTLATEQILLALASGSTRTVSLGRVGERYFTFNSGMGIDAEVVRAVEEERGTGRSISNAMHLRATVRQVVRSDRRRPRLSVRWRPNAAGPVDPDASSGAAVEGGSDGMLETLAGGPPGTPTESAEPAFLVFVSNVSPWTYYGNREIVTNASTRPEAGLGLFAVTRMSMPVVLGIARRMIRPVGSSNHRALLHHDDVAAVRVTADRPVAVQADGDYLGEWTDVLFTHVPQAVTVVV